MNTTLKYVIDPTAGKAALDWLGDNAFKWSSICAACGTHKHTLRSVFGGQPTRPVSFARICAAMSEQGGPEIDPQTGRLKDDPAQSCLFSAHDADYNDVANELHIQAASVRNARSQVDALCGIIEDLDNWLLIIQQKLEALGNSLVKT